MAIATTAILDSFALEATGPNRFRGDHAEMGHAVVFGGQLMGQSLVAAAAAAGPDGKRPKTLHIIFARAASPDAPMEIDVEPIHAGRAFSSVSVTTRQGDRVCTKAQVLLTAEEPDFIRHGLPAPDLEPPSDALNDGSWQNVVVGGVDISDPDAIGPAELDVWTRFDGAPADDPMLNAALLAFATDGFLIGTAMRPHAGVGQAQAHRTLSTGVVSHTLTFHDPVDAGGWLLLRNRAAFAGGGRSWGNADIFSATGGYVAAYVQDAMIRPMGEGAKL